MARVHRLRVTWVAVALTAALAACQPTPSDDGSASPGDGDVTTLTPTEEPTTTTEPTSEPAQTGELDEASQAAVDDLAERLGVDAATITAGPLEQVTWPDGSIGCPEAGKMYTQMLEDGRRLILTVDGTEYAYHGKGDEPLFYCANPTEPTQTESM